MNGNSHHSLRKGHRLPVRLPFSLIVGAGSNEFTIPAESINVSKSGMRVRRETQLYSGQTVEVILLEGTPRPIVARVVWAGKPTNPHQYEFGLQYLTPSPRPV